MKLIALKHISQQRPKGSIFDEGGTKAKILLAIKAAAVYREPSRATEPIRVAPEPNQEPEQIQVVMDVEPPQEARTRGRRVGTGTFTGTYQRRDLQPEPKKS